MSKFIVGTFLVLGWTFYELSGGADFVPEERVVAEAEEVVEETPVVAAVVEPEPVVEEAPVVEVAVTRNETSNILNLSTGALVQPAVEAAVVEEPVVPEATDVEVVLAAVEEALEPEVIETPDLDIRFVSGTRVNMRSGPGTDYAVLDTLPGGTEAEVIEVDATGWARIRLPESGAVGWMAERLLSES